MVKRLTIRWIKALELLWSDQWAISGGNTPHHLLTRGPGVMLQWSVDEITDKIWCFIHRHIDIHDSATSAPACLENMIYEIKITGNLAWLFVSNQAISCCQGIIETLGWFQCCKQTSTSTYFTCFDIYHSGWTPFHPMYENSTLCTKRFVHRANAAGTFIVHQANAAGAFIVHQGNVVEHFGSYIK